MRLVFVSILILLSISTYAQVPDSVYYKRLFYVCKTWGHIKYYHTEIANGNVNWDNVLLNTISGIKNASDSDSFNDSLLIIINSAGTMGTSTETLPDIIDSLFIVNYEWIHNPIFSNSVKAKLDTIVSRFRPQSNVYINETEWGTLNFGWDQLYYHGDSYPTEEKRILALFRYWNIINYFFPYKHIMDQNWDTSLIEFIPQIIGAKDAISYNLAFKELTTRINDSHGIYFNNVTYINWLGHCYPPFLVKQIESEMVITQVLPQITEVSIGDIIKEIDGVDIYQLRDSLRRYAHGSNDIIIENELNNIIMHGAIGSFAITVNGSSSIHSELMSRNHTNYAVLMNSIPTNPSWQDTLVNENNHFGIVDMGSLKTSEIETMFSDLWNTDAIIFDLRNYPQWTLYDIANYLYSSPTHFVNFTIPDITYPGKLFWHEEYIGNGSTNPYSGKIMILFDERTISRAEYFCMGLEQIPNAIKIGSTTAGADGDVSNIYLPGTVHTMASFIGVYYPDYSQTQRVGIIPDYKVLPTIAGIKAGKDEVMEYALNFNFSIINENKISENINLFPNPTNNILHYKFANKLPFLMELYDMQGHKIKAINLNSSYGEIDISDLRKGIYIVKVFTDKITLSKLIVKH